MKSIVLLALAVVLSGAATAQAQDTSDEFGEETLSTGDGLAVPSAPATSLTPPSEYESFEWASMPGGPDGVVDPIYVTQRDYGLIAAGGVMAAVSYLLGASISTFLGVIGGCGWYGGSCEPGLGALGLIPLGHWAAGFSGTSASVGAIIAGGVLTPFELVGLIIMLAGLGHNHPVLAPRESFPARPQAALDGGPAADAGGLELCF